MEKKAHKSLQPSDKTLKELAVKLTQYQVCVDVFVTTKTYSQASITIHKTRWKLR